MHRNCLINYIFIAVACVGSLAGEGLILQACAAINHPEIVIEIGASDFDKLKAKKIESLKNKVILISSEDYVPARMKIDGNIYTASIGLKEVVPQNLADSEKWPLDIKIGNAKTVWGRSRFSIRNPDDKGFVKEFLFNETVKSEGLLGLDFKFANVTINGKAWGIIAVELKFESGLETNQQSDEGFIINSFDDMIEIAMGRMNSSGVKSNPVSSTTQINHRELLSRKHSQHYKKAIRLLSKIRSGVIESSQVLDMDKWIKLYILKTLFGIYHHSVSSPYFKFYYSPQSGLLEPVSYEPQYIPHLIFPKNSEFLINIEAQEIYRRYIAEFDRISREQNIEKIISKFTEMLSQSEDLKNLPEVGSEKASLVTNALIAKISMTPVKHLSAYFSKIENKSLVLTIGNINGNFPLLIESVSFNKSTVFKPESKIVVPSKSPTVPIMFVDYKFEIPEGFSWSDNFKNNLTVNFRVLGHSKLNEDKVHPEPMFYDHIFDKTNVIRTPNFREFRFLEINEDQKEVVVLRGKWVVARTLVIPEGYKVVAEEGVELDMINGAMIISYSPISFRGSAQNPILIHSSNSSGQGLAVINSQGSSMLHFVNFEGLANPSISDWALTGAVTFYESELFISHCKFIDNRAEDGLNVVRSKFHIKNTLFKGNKSDALDSDFSRGKLSNAKFVRNGNDAMDVSGGHVVISDIVVNGSGDKGLSVGENSRVTAENLVIDSTPMAIASKDLSVVSLDNVKISGSTVGLAAYQKKSEYGPAKLWVDNLVLDDVVLPYHSEKKSQVKIDQKVMKESQIKTKTLLLKLERWAEPISRNE